MNQECKQVFEALQWASSFLEEKNREANAARLLLQHVLAVDYTGLMLNMREPLTEEQQQQFEELIHAHIAGKPVQYLIGTEQFYGRTFQVNEAVLIPRPETEELVKQALDRMTAKFGDASLSLVDIGTGSGAIAVTLKKERPSLQVTATDLSEDALQTAKQNAQLLEADVTFLQGDLTAPVQHQKFDVVLSNPPYIAFDEVNVMNEVVLEHEPHTALFAEENGLQLYRRLCEELPHIVHNQAIIGFEIGYQQGGAVYNLLKKSFPQGKVEVLKDLFGQDRMVFCEIG
ncbi:peptide chain release factor N(5)-glutamine methyltransferase [Kurthia gibsonii]|uniref:peptide chain release factor N(5)-glutamine methyltransferase n=1 Tax=Kurthia gibsonii TaxID=33946 RepID=UPI002DBDD9AB|nr:peptide chain release factor N(5)-glutamine methyltransferase [Kurthia gibsonii]MEB7772037.1 peptide chain release factor N(5)-glutamine methyltransferase [Kurthia gibsonii]